MTLVFPRCWANFQTLNNCKKNKNDLIISLAIIYLQSKIFFTKPKVFLLSQSPKQYHSIHKFIMLLANSYYNVVNSWQSNFFSTFLPNYLDELAINKNLIHHFTLSLNNFHTSWEEMLKQKSSFKNQVLRRLNVGVKNKIQQFLHSVTHNKIQLKQPSIIFFFTHQENKMVNQMDQITKRINNFKLIEKEKKIVSQMHSQLKQLEKQRGKLQKFMDDQYLMQNMTHQQNEIINRKMLSFNKTLSEKRKLTKTKQNHLNHKVICVNSKVKKLLEDARSYFSTQLPNQTFDRKNLSKKYELIHQNEVNSLVEQYIPKTSCFKRRINNDESKQILDEFLNQQLSNEKKDSYF